MYILLTEAGNGRDRDRERARTHATTVCAKEQDSERKGIAASHRFPQHGSTNKPTVKST